MIDMNDLYAKFSVEQREKILKAIRNQNQAGEGIPVQLQLKTPLPLSLAQQRLWFLEQLEGPSALYNMPCILKLTGQIQIKALQAAFKHIIQRHAVLRTRFIEQDGLAWQVVEPEVLVNLAVQDSVSETAISSLIAQEVAQPFNLAYPPLIRANLYKLTAEQSVLLVVMHHIVSDSWSLRIFMQELSEAYKACCEGQLPPNPDLPIQYADYSIWQHQQIQTEKIQKQWLYWQEQLKDLPGLLNLPIEKSRPSKQTYNGAHQRFQLDSSVLEQLKLIARQHKVTLYILLLSIFNVLLHCYSSQEDIMVGTPVANRTRKETEPLIGFFINTLVMRNQVNPNQTFSEFLQQVKYNVINAFDHQDIPFDFLVEKLRPERSMSHSPLFQVEFSLQNALPQEMQMQDLKVEVLPFDSPLTQFDLTLSFEEKGNQLHGLIEYNTDLFHPTFISRLPGHYIQLVSTILKRTDLYLRELSCLTEAEEHQLLRDWAQNPHAFSIDKTFDQLFIEQVQMGPERIAVIHGENQLTYEALNRKVQQYLRGFLTNGVQRGDRVAFYLDRGIPYLCAMLAALKVGAVFVPFNPESNLERNRELLKRARLRCIVSESRVAPHLEAVDLKIPVLWIEAISDCDPLVEFTGEVQLEDPAYMIYTSGSTGQPKAAVVEQWGMINHLWAKVHALKLHEKDRIAQIAVQTFDVSVWQFLIALITGATTVILTGEAAWEPEQLWSSVERYQISILETVPSHLTILLNEKEKYGQKYNLACLRYMISNGEPIPASECMRWFRLFPQVPFMNAYGPTECSDDVTHLCLEAPPHFDLPYLPAGQPIPNARIYLLNEFLKPVPIGVIGEIYIGGRCVGQGYFEDSERTQMSFMSNPFVQGERLYKSGDLAKYHENGLLEFLGRRDFQLKIRGFRIEPGEVESALQKHPDVERCLVMGVENPQGQLQLVAYVVSPVHPMPNAETLRKFCHQHLPDYLVPAYIILLDDFPMLKNGKIDRKQLPLPLEQEWQGGAEYISPRTDQEKQLSAIWSSVIGVEKIGVRDHFFQIGGHSLLAVELVSEMKKILGEDVSLQMLFKHPTIEGIIAAIHTVKPGDYNENL